MSSDLDSSVREWGMWCHLSILCGIALNVIIPIPFIGIVVTFLVWQNGRNRHPFIDEQGKASLNFQISMAIYAIGSLLLFALLLIPTCGMMLSGSTSANIAGTIFLVIAAIAMAFYGLYTIFLAVAAIVGSVKAHKGQSYHYPFTLQFLR